MGLSSNSALDTLVPLTIFHWQIVEFSLCTMNTDLSISMLLTRNVQIGNGSSRKLVRYRYPSGYTAPGYRLHESSNFSPSRTNVSSNFESINALPNGGFVAAINKPW